MKKVLRLFSGIILLGVFACGGSKDNGPSIKADFVISEAVADGKYLEGERLSIYNRSTGNYRSLRFKVSNVATGFVEAEVEQSDTITYVGSVPFTQLSYATGKYMAELTIYEQVNFKGASNAKKLEFTVVSQ